MLDQACQVLPAVTIMVQVVSILAIAGSFAVPYPLPRLRTLLMISFMTISAASAEEARFLQLGTGPSGEARFLLGGRIANALSSPPGVRLCGQEGACGIPGTVVVAKSSAGSIANIQGLLAGRLDAALIRSEVVLSVLRGQSPVSDLEIKRLDTVGVIYAESVHVVVRAATDWTRLSDLKGKKIAVDDKATPNGALARLVLTAHGLPDSKVRLVAMKPMEAAAALAEGSVDAFITIDADPAPQVAELSRRSPIRVLPLDDGVADRLSRQYGWLTVTELPGGEYIGTEDPLVTVAAQVVLMVRADLDPAIARAMLRTLRNPATLAQLAAGDPRGRLVWADPGAAAVLGLPLHKGASVSP